MTTPQYLHRIVQHQKQGIPRGIYSICSAHRFVLEAALEKGQQEESHILIEATCNQVNQDGGYTGMTPQQFVDVVEEIGKRCHFPEEHLILGGDHLGPNPWQHYPAAMAMDNACTLVHDYVTAGFSKIHLDASMFLADDDDDRSRPLAPELVAERTACLCVAAEAAAGPDAKPVYVIGTEVPVPGGFQGDSEDLHVTTAADFRETVELTHKAFFKRGLYDAWERVIAVVVQPGVEFGDQHISEYRRPRARELCGALYAYPNLVFEGHSTDYQRPDLLKQMVEDGIAILKVGPALTFAMREAIFLLCSVEQELALLSHDFEPSNLVAILDRVMVDNPKYWEKYYRGNAHFRQFSREYSLSDRSRYYWGEPAVQRALQHLFAHLERIDIPLPLLSQFFPQQYRRVRQGSLKNAPREFVKDRINDVLRGYSHAVTPDPT